MVQFEGSQARKFHLTQERLGFCNFQAFIWLDEDITLVRKIYFIQFTNSKVNIIQKNLLVTTQNNSRTGI